jgi:hypothetical protein
MPIALAAVAVVGLGLSVYQTVDAKKKQKEAEKAAAEYERQQLKNPYENLQVSTMGADLQQQNLNNQVATATDALRAGGSRAIIGGLPTLYDNVIQANNQIAAGLDSQFNQNQQLSAQGNAMVQGMTEQRERDDLLGIGNAINNAQQEYNQGLSNTVKSIANVASAASTIPTSSSTSTNTSATPSFGSTGIFGRNAVAVQPLKFNNQPILSTPKITDQADAIAAYNRYLYGNRGF